MTFLPLVQRKAVPELMDAPDLDQAVHRAALAGLERLNTASRAAQTMVQPILALARQRRLNRMRVLDVACGGGGVPTAIATLARQASVELELTLTDRSPTALQEAQRRTADSGFAGRCLQGEAPDQLPQGSFDVVTNSLFLHHLSAAEVVGTLIAMRARTRRLLVVSDLRRSLLGWVVAWGACRMLSRSPIVHFDGPTSVRAAWTISEMRQMARQAGLDAAQVSNCWPWRMQLIWQNPEAAHA